MDYNALAKQLVSDAQFSRDYRAIKALGRQMLLPLIRLHVARVNGRALDNRDAAMVLDQVPHVSVKPYGGSVTKTAKPWPFATTKPIAGPQMIIVDDSSDDAYDAAIFNHFFKTPQPAVQPFPAAAQEIQTMSSNKFISTKTYVGGVDFDNMNDDTVYARVAAMEAEVEQLEKTKTKPASLVARIDQIKANIKALVELADARYTKKKAKDDADAAPAA